LETATSINQLRIAETTEIKKNMESMENTGKNKKKMTASERRFAKEIEVLVNMSLSDLMKVEKTRMTMGV
jgi:hypothetical protein